MGAGRQTWRAGPGFQLDHWDKECCRKRSHSLFYSYCWIACKQPYLRRLHDANAVKHTHKQKKNTGCSSGFAEQNKSGKLIIDYVTPIASSHQVCLLSPRLADPAAKTTPWRYRITLYFGLQWLVAFPNRNHYVNRWTSETGTKFPELQQKFQTFQFGWKILIEIFVPQPESTLNFKICGQQDLLDRVFAGLYATFCSDVNYNLH